MIDWHRLPGRRSLALVLMIAMSNTSTKLTAGNLFELSLSTFGDVSNAMSMSIIFFSRMSVIYIQFIEPIGGQDIGCLLKHVTYVNVKLIQSVEIIDVINTLINYRYHIKNTEKKNTNIILINRKFMCIILKNICLKISIYFSHLFL